MLHNATVCDIMMQKEDVMSTVAIRLSDTLIQQATNYARFNFRTVPKQIEYWATLGRCAEDNPDLPLGFIKECLLAKEEIKQGKTTEFNFKEN